MFSIGTAQKDSLLICGAWGCSVSAHTFHKKSRSKPNIIHLSQWGWSDGVIPEIKKMISRQFWLLHPIHPLIPPPSSTKERRELRSIFMFLKLGNTELIETNYLSAVTGWKPTQGFSSTTVFMYSKSCWLHSWADSTAPSGREWGTNWSGKLLRENHLENPLSVALFSDYRCIWY